MPEWKVCQVRERDITCTILMSVLTISTMHFTNFPIWNACMECSLGTRYSILPKKLKTGQFGKYDSCKPFQDKLFLDCTKAIHYVCTYVYIM